MEKVPAIFRSKTRLTSLLSVGILLIIAVFMAPMFIVFDHVKPADGGATLERISDTHFREYIDAFEPIGIGSRFHSHKFEYGDLTAFSNAHLAYLPPTIGQEFDEHAHLRPRYFYRIEGWEGDFIAVLIPQKNYDDSSGSIDTYGTVVTYQPDGTLIDYQVVMVDFRKDAFLGPFTRTRIDIEADNRLTVKHQKRVRVQPGETSTGYWQTAGQYRIEKDGSIVELVQGIQREE